MKPNRKIVVTAAIVLFVAMGIAASRPPEEKFKNLKVLPKYISDRAIDKVMEEFSKALGVKCNFCHVQIDSTNWDMASDQKAEKNIARKMIKMSNKINKGFFKAKTKYGEENAVLEIHCVTCHRGEPHPEVEQVPKQKGNQ
ncbi:MAG TPA: c-type cytochrome [Chitinophagaceae bacterium]|nr:c-type cytochrome [Chitinophagaceae bacterium]